MFSVERLRAGLNTKFLGREVIYLDQTSSTNDDAWNYFHNGSPNGTLVITDDQQHGRGRRKNKWFSTKEKSLTFSFILHPEIGLGKLGLFPLLTGVSIVQSIKSSASIQTGLKWPNDIMLNGKKMGGILIESRTTQNRLGVVVGVGLNINETMQDIPNFLKDQTSSLAIYSEASCNRERILSAVLNNFERLYTQEWDSIIPIWRKYCIHKDSEVVFHTENGLHQGIFQGISSDGHAEIQINGKTHTFPSGIITL